MTHSAPSPARRRTPLEAFLQTEAAGGLFLVLAAAAALLWANGPFSESYRALRDFPIAIEVGGFRLAKPLLLWVNDLLMAVFFFVVGLEIKREILVGELAGRKRAMLPVMAALGGMLVPAGIYLLFNPQAPERNGFGVPMATDIAFAVGMLALLGRRVPVALKVFLLALAIIDDLGAVLLIALFYTAELASGPLALAALVWLGAAVYGHLGGGRAGVFLLFGALLWFLVFQSGVHATLAGVALAFAVPIAHRVDPKAVAAELRRRAAGDFEDIEMTIGEAAQALVEARSPLHRFEHGLAPWVAWAIMPLFALLNAGVAFTDLEGAPFASPVLLGVATGLLVGKPLGVVGACLLAERLGLAHRPAGVSYGAILGVGLIAGIGFTMALFIAGLAFPDPAVLDQAKLGILTGSLAAALLGLACLHLSLRPKRERPAA